MFKKMIALILLVTATGCATVKESTRIDTALTAREFNAIASQYLFRPTFVEMRLMNDGEQYLFVSTTAYSGEQQGLHFAKSRADGYIALINKYLKWESLARERQDSFTKEIGKDEAWKDSSTSQLAFTFHSGNATTHYLDIAFCSVGTCLDGLYFDRGNAQALQSLLQSFKSGTLKHKEISSAYN